MDIEAARAALNAIVERHQILRTQYVYTEDGPRQRVRENVQVPFAIHDLTTLDDRAQGARINGVLEKEARTSFDLELDVMLRATFMLTHLEPEGKGILSLMFITIASDGWSMEILRKEFMTLYSAYSNGLTSPIVTFVNSVSRLCPVATGTTTG